MGYRYDKSRYFEMPKLFYFEAGNTTVGSLNTFNYRIVPEKEKMVVSVWYGLMCSELSDTVAEECFGMNREGYIDMIYWLDDRFEEYREKLIAGEVAGSRTFSGDMGVV